jgi:hypothetical protein
MGTDAEFGSCDAGDGHDASSGSLGGKLEASSGREFGTVEGYLGSDIERFRFFMNLMTISLT